jgi:hypothetical protein
VDQSNVREVRMALQNAFRRQDRKFGHRC